MYRMKTTKRFIIERVVSKGVVCICLYDIYYYSTSKFNLFSHNKAMLRFACYYSRKMFRVWKDDILSTKEKINLIIHTRVLFSGICRNKRNIA